MRIVGVTGGVGSGKSEVMKILQKEYCANIIMADDIAKNLSVKGQDGYFAIVNHFGPSICMENGEIDRKKLAEIVFGNKQERLVLNGITHPLVRKAIESEIDRVKSEQKYTMIAIEAALLIEANYFDVCDEFWYVYTSDLKRRQRLKSLRNYSDEKIDNIFNSQLSDADFRRYCSRIIDNNGDIQHLRRQLQMLLKEDSNG